MDGETDQERQRRLRDFFELSSAQFVARYGHRLYSTHREVFDIPKVVKDGDDDAND